MKKSILVTAAILLLALPCFAASVVPSNLAIDFRSNDWTGAYGQNSFSVGNITASATDSNDVLYQDRYDGLGIQGGENDEINHPEQLLITITGGMFLTGVWITDLFGPPDGDYNYLDGAYGKYGEYGNVTLNNDSALTFDFLGRDADQHNGEILVDFGGSRLISQALFEISGGSHNNEFSVAGFTAQVPEPGTMLLLGLGLIGLSGLGRSKLLKRR